MSGVVATSKRAVAAAVVHSPLVRLLERRTNGLATVFLCHRFDLDDPGQTSDSTAVLRETLEWLRRRRYNLVTVEDVVRSHRGEGPPLPARSVAFTIDDGYIEQAEVASSVFAAYDCPVTIFLATGFLDGDVLPWWDAIGHVLAHTRLDRLEVPAAIETTRFELTEDDGVLEAQHRLQDHCKDLLVGERDEFIAALAELCDVDLPRAPVAPYLPMTWDRARELENGELIRFGPHTVTHPILSKVEDAAAESEMRRSWTRVREELERPVPIFCYPNGEPGDFAQREVEVARAMGMIGAVTVDVGHADPTTRDAFRVQRVPFCPDPLDNLQWVSGLELAQQRVRARASARS